MYRLIRNVHLALGVGFTLVWLMYGLSSVQMAHPDWFPMEPERSEARVAVAPTAAPDARALSVALAERGAVRGDVRSPATAGDTLRFQVVRPGTVHQVSYVAGAATATVVTNVGGFMTMLNRLHHYGGFWHVWGPLDLWGLLVALASVGLMVLGVSGIYLWFRTYGERRLGTALLGFSLAFGVAMTVLIRAAG